MFNFFMKKKQYLLTLFLIILYGKISAQYFEPLLKSFYPSSVDLVDSLMPIGAPLVTLKDDGAQIFYYQEISKPEKKIGMSSSVKTFKIIDGEIVSSEYNSPFVYYVIADFPGEPSRYYGFYTTSYGDIFQLQDHSVKDIHPQGFSGPIYGTVVFEDGTTKTAVLKKRSEMEKDKVAKPVGSYKLYDIFGLEYIEFTFNTGGMGSVKFVDYPSKEAIIAESGGSSTFREKGNKKLRTVNHYTGGYTIIKNATATGKMKWSLSPENLLKIELLSNPIVKTPVKIDWSDLDKKNVFSSKSDRQLLINQREADLPTNEHVIESKKLLNKRMLKLWAEKSNLEINTPYIGRNMILGQIIDSEGRIHVMEKNPANLNYSKLIRNAESYIKQFGTKRKYGIDYLYEEFVRKGKAAIEANPEFSQAEYQVVDINPLTRTSNLVYISKNKKLNTELSFDHNWNLSLSSANSKEDHSLANLYDTINQNNFEIMTYEKDKQRKKVVNEYKKKFKGYNMPEEFNSFTEYDDLIRNANKILELQDYYLKYLK